MPQLPARCPSSRYTCRASHHRRSAGSRGGCGGRTGGSRLIRSRRERPWRACGGGPRTSGSRWHAVGGGAGPALRWRAWPSSTAWPPPKRCATCASTTTRGPSKRPGSAGSSFTIGVELSCAGSRSSPGGTRQQVVQVTFGGRDWRRAPEIADLRAATHPPAPIRPRHLVHGSQHRRVGRALPCVDRLDPAEPIIALIRRRAGRGGPIRRADRTRPCPARATPRRPP